MMNARRQVNKGQELRAVIPAVTIKYSDDLTFDLQTRTSRSFGTYVNITKFVVAPAVLEFKLGPLAEFLVKQAIEAKATMLRAEVPYEMILVFETLGFVKPLEKTYWIIPVKWLVALIKKYAGR